MRQGKMRCPKNKRLVPKKERSVEEMTEDKFVKIVMENMLTTKSSRK